MVKERERRIAVDVGVLVAEMGRSLAFYRDLLGLPVVADVPTTLIGRGRMVQLAHGRSLIKLVEMAEQPPRGMGSLTAVTGFRYITLLVPDIAAIVEKCRQQAIDFPLPLTQLPSGTWIAMTVDPDGNIVEFVQENGQG
jgi:catechol 2,3-dioxygenase-like lactoylglutathione lyase family enzyme